MAREVNLWTWMRDGLKAVPLLHLRRLENLVGEGDPDVMGCYAGKYFDIELKGCHRPPGGGKLNFEVRRAQVIWHRRRARCGGNNWFYIRVGSGRDIKRYLVEGKLGEWLESGVSEADLARASPLPPGHTARDLLDHVASSDPHKLSPSI